MNLLVLVLAVVVAFVLAFVVARKLGQRKPPEQGQPANLFQSLDAFAAPQPPSDLPGLAREFTGRHRKWQRDQADVAEALDLVARDRGEDEDAPKAK